MISKIKTIEFSLLDPKEILDYSVCEITTTNLYEKNNPVFNSLFDTRMGVTNNSFICLTCNNDFNTCPGHFGHIVLEKMVYLPHYLKTIVKLLQISCIYCSKIPEITNKNILKLKKSSRFLYYYTNTKDSQCCFHCGNIKPKFSTDMITLFYTEQNMEKKVLHANNCYDIVSKINNTDIELLGFDEKCRPEWMIISILPVVPPCIRPSINYDGGMRSESDLTYKYIDIIKSNNSLKTEIVRYTNDLKKISNDEKIEFSKRKQKIINDRYLHLQINITTLMNNKLSNVLISQNKNNKAFKCFTERLSGKHGRIRGNLLGKRIDYSARSVISPDASLDIDELGVPYEIAKTLTICEDVNEFNKLYLQQMVNNGSTYPGAEYIIRNKISYSIKILLDNPNLHEKLKLSYGDKVERHIIDGDYVLFNRQPTLHKFSAQGHRVKVLKYQTFRLNPNVVTAYNADF